MEQRDVRVGQIWEDADPRSEGRRIRVVEISQAHAVVELVAERGRPWSGLKPGEAQRAQPGRRTRIRLDRFKPTSSGYRLVQDAPGVDVARLAAVRADQPSRLRDGGLTVDVAQANAAFDILVEHAGAGEWMREQFVYLHANGRCDEFRFQGLLGFGGKFWRQRWDVTAYREDMTPERQRVIEATNAALAAIRPEGT